MMEGPKLSIKQNDENKGIKSVIKFLFFFLTQKTYVNAEKKRKTETQTPPAPHCNFISPCTWPLESDTVIESDNCRI